MTDQQQLELHKDITHLTRWVQASIAVGLIFFAAFAWQLVQQHEDTKRNEDRFYELQKNMDDRFYDLLKQVNESTNTQNLKIQKLELTKEDKKD
ncbi:hypothetical protein [Vibrio parahaemolyticus]|uniref:hypothetical protein n=1 Tax=Vibrio parahaemolyticus TaxID=670 RepID=UPI00226B1EBC|nr:hypothetical protein [Vibrio parahaemolyticus]MCX8941249.1 hypothetical protein [Vibrio parahaemolyticus]